MKTLSDIKKIAVLGAGTMGPGIAQAFACGGYPVSIWTRSQQTRQRAEQALAQGLRTYVQQGMLTEQEALAARQRITFAETVAEAVRDADLISETIVENPEAKRALYEELLGLIAKDVIVASNTSALNIFEVVPEAMLPQQLIAHWYAPAHIIPLVEVVKSQQAPQWMADVVMELLRACGKSPVLMQKYIRGYIVNRLQQCLTQEMYFLLDNGYCTPEDIDLAVKTSFIPRAMVLGLCRRADFAGLNMAYNLFRNGSCITSPTEMPHLLQELVESGNLGVKSGKGLYDYTGMDVDALMAKRDKQLLEAFRLEKELLKDPV